MTSNYRRRCFSPAGIFRLPHHRDPALIGVRYTVPVESSLLHFSGIDELSKEGTFCFRPALVNNSGSIRTIRFFRAGVNYFRDVIQRPLAQYEHNRGVTIRIRWVSPFGILQSLREAIAAPSMCRLAGAPESA